MGFLFPQCTFVHWALLCAARSSRYGEALHPGPGEFCLGTFNPTGLAAKHSLVPQLAPGVYSVTETHLSSRGIHDFRLGLKLGGSGFQLHHGHPVPLRPGSAVAGQYSGVGFVSSFAGRASPHAWPPELFQTARLHVSSFLVGNLWILGGVAYGFATDKARTLPLLDALLDRVLAQRTGLRFVSGDWNLEPHQLPQLERLRQQGFIDVQDLRYARTGVPPEATCKRSTRKDFLFALFQSASVDDTYWPDHASVLATFRFDGNALSRFQWRMPAQRDLSQCPSLLSGPVEAYTSPTRQFTAICEAYEASLSAAEVAAGRAPLTSSECGRGRYQDVKCVRVTTAPVRTARQGEHAPLYFGQNMRYGQWMRQLRRLQSLLHSVQRNSATPQAVEQRSNLWVSIRRAPGFPGSFPAWWPCRPVQLVGDPAAVPQTLPSAHVAESLVVSFEANFRDFEKSLMQSRRHGARKRRIEDPSLIFRDFKRPLAAPVETLLDHRHAEVEELCHDEVAITLAQEVEWDTEVSFHCGAAPLHVVHVEPDKLWLSSLDPISEGCTVSQVRHVGSLLEVFAEFGQQWGSRWMRHAVPDLAHWERVLCDLSDQVRFPPLVLPPVTLDEWRNAVRQKSPRSVPGPDGLCRADLLHMPDSLTAQILDLCQAAEHTGSWPLQLLEGIVSSLEKIPQASRVSDFRPICVLSLVYRVWSSIRAKAALAHLAKHAPPGMFGTLPGCDSSDVWMSLQLAVESSHRSGVALYGISADLTKAFNMLPRLPVLGLARLCGLPDTLIRPWLSAITGLRRRFRVRGSVGPAILSNCGFPEGDPLSCVAMCVANTAFHLHMQRTRSPSRTLSFVDNYECTAATCEGILEAHASLMEFSRTWDMPVDVAKTTVWSTSAQGRSQLRQAGFKVLLDFRDLGAHLQVSRRYSNHTQIDRIHSLDDRWPRLASSLAPVAQKIRALSTAAWPAALHAVSVAPVGECHFSSLRSNMKGLNLKAPGANPLLQLSLMEFPVADPFFFAVRASFLDLKCLAGPEVVCPLLTAAVESDSRQPGPATLLVCRANLLGISWHPGSCTFRDAFGTFDLWRVSSAEIQVRLCYAWQIQVQQRLCHRPTFRGLDNVDPALTRRLFRAFPPQEQAFLRLSLNGTFFTNDALCHCGEDESRDCRYCGQPDSLEHRVLLCPHFASCRTEAGVPDACLHSMPPAQVLHSWVPAPRSLFEVRKALAGIAGRFEDIHFYPDADCLDLFTDGSCLKPQEPCLRLAAWAVVYAPLTDESASQLLSAGLVPGLLQSPYRGELCAVISALHVGWLTGRKLRVWTDCQSLLHRFLAWKAGRWRPSQRSRHWDLWSEVVPFFDEIQDFVTFHKVDAHCRAEDEAQFVDEWCARHNAAVDAAAKHAQTLRDSSFWAKWNSLCGEVAETVSLGKKVMRLHVLIARRSILTKPSREPVVSEVPIPRDDDVSWLGTVPPHSVLKLSQRYGGRYIGRLQRWGDMLQGEPSSLRWTSTLQLYILFCLTWVAAPPVLHKGVWQDLSLIPNGQYVDVPLTRRVQFFQQTIRQFTKLSGGRWLTRELRPLSSALQARLSCVAIRVSDASWLAVERFLAQHLPAGVVRSHERSWSCLPIPKGSLQ